MGNPSKILLVEDDLVLRLVVEKQLKSLGYDFFESADNGLQGVDAALATRFDLILMDIHLPKLDGLEATQQIRAAGADSIIIGMTASPERERCLTVGMDDFLQKPVLLDQLARILRQWAPMPELSQRREPDSSNNEITPNLAQLSGPGVFLDS